MVAADSSATADIQLNPQGQDLAAQLGISIADLESAIRDNVTKAFGLAPVESFTRSFANATSFSNRGLGVDYASNIEGAELGIAASAGAAADLGHGVPTAGIAPRRGDRVDEHVCAVQAVHAADRLEASASRRVIGIRRSRS